MVQNRLAKPAQQTATDMVEYESDGQRVKLSPAMIRKYLVSGNGAVSDQEVMMFLSLCKFQKLNPFLKEAYLIKYGSQPAAIVIGKEAFMKRARRNPNYAGHVAGVVVMDNHTGNMENRVGTIVLPEVETLLGGWATVYVKGWELPLTVTVAFDEYCLRKDGKPASNWAIKPATMIRKVALVQALREAFPADLGGMYTAEETGDAIASDIPIDITPDDAEPAQAAETVEPQVIDAPPATYTKPASSARDALFGN